MGGQVIVALFPCAALGLHLFAIHHVASVYAPVPHIESTAAASTTTERNRHSYTRQLLTIIFVPRPRLGPCMPAAPSRQPFFALQKGTCLNWPGFGVLLLIQ
ncbi:hypothetical protein LZ32DRAFT_421299 [Colletotrichum eremochloae]|nr:hypothetical protein LZ32DRAFT_421299 [Colletotrichum eremochloae]